MRAYLLPIIVGVVLLGLLAGWAVNEQQQTEATALDALTEESRAVSAALEGSLQANTRRGRFQKERFQSLMDSIAATGDIRFVLWTFRALPRRPSMHIYEKSESRSRPR